MTSNTAYFGVTRFRRRLSNQISLCFLFEIPGMFSNSLHEAHLTIPRKTNNKGELMSLILNHHHEHDHYTDGKGEPEDHTVHYQIDFHNETLHLELEWVDKLLQFLSIFKCGKIYPIRPSTRFVAPMMVVERHKRDLRERHKKSQHQTQCHYQGKIRGHEDSKVALSACNGLVRT